MRNEFVKIESVGGTDDSITEIPVTKLDDTWTTYVKGKRDRVASSDSLLAIADFCKDYERYIEKMKELLCECYCKFPDEYRAMYHDPTEAQENMDREKCNYCPLMNL